MPDLVECATERLILGDGDLTAELARLGTVGSVPVELLALENPAALTPAYEAFLAAGARILRTATRQTDRAFLETHHLLGRLNEMLWQAAQIARSAARGHGAWVAATLNQDPGAGVAGYRARIGPLLDGGADVVFFDAFTDARELCDALEAKHSLHHCPAICLPDPGLAQRQPEIFRILEKEAADFVAWRGPAEGVLAAAKGLPTDTLSPAFVADAGSLPFAMVPAGLSCGILFGGRGILPSDYPVRVTEAPVITEIPTRSDLILDPPV